MFLSEITKFFERVVARRLQHHLEGTGPDLSDQQYGFRSGRSTMDAILEVKSYAQDAVARGDGVLAVSLDIANAFNSLPWPCIKEALIYHRVPPYPRGLSGG